MARVTARAVVEVARPVEQVFAALADVPRARGLVAQAVPH